MRVVRGACDRARVRVLTMRSYRPCGHMYMVPLSWTPMNEVAAAPEGGKLQFAAPSEIQPVLENNMGLFMGIVAGRQGNRKARLRAALLLC